ncbi:MAG: Porphobilinogen deaminase [Ktedonobacterales bacterium]|nr:MAG: Porphobilinogen deaminase [Ktedonobacterales bacterium]
MKVDSPTTQTAAPQARHAQGNAMMTVGTRGSALALWQTNWVVARLRSRVPGVAFQIETLTTKGDRTQDSQVPLTQLGDKSMFVAELERALLAGDLDVAVHAMHDRALVSAEREVATERPIDAAVHSLKDLPGTLDARLTLAAVPAREDPRDALVSRSGLTLDALPQGAVVATSSLRRRAQLLHLRPDLQIVDIRGNVDTRLRKALAPDGPDAIVLAAAGLRRLGLDGHITELLPVERLVPAVGQGALAVETRASDTHTRKLLRQIDDPATRQAVTAERAVLAALGGGCQVPLGAHAQITADGVSLHLIAVVASLDGQRLVRVEREGPLRRSAALGRSVARELLRQGGADILREILV